MKHIDEIPHPHIRLFPHYSECKRRVVVKISLFRGYGHHFYVDLTEEHNPVWDEETGRWIVPAGDEDGAGEQRVMGFATERHARRWIEAIFHERFSEATHELHVHGDVTEHWLYGEGD